MKREEIPAPSPPVVEKAGASVTSAEAELVSRLRGGDREAGRRFFREYYPGVYHYLLWLTRQPETAEDLAQETFLRACRHLDRFDDRGPLRAWLHTIAHREFLRHLRSRREQVSLEAVAEAVDPHPGDPIDAVEWRELIRKLPVEEGEVVVLHYLQGYDCSEIARIAGVPVSTVKYRLSAARAHLQRELGAGDLLYLNAPEGRTRGWGWLPLDRIHALENRLERGFRIRQEEPMERREFLRQAASGAAGVMVAGVADEKDVVDARLTRKVTLAAKGMALSDLCECLREKTQVSLVAGASVADEKVTLFCRSQPLRDVMRQLSRPFGYTWLRSRREEAYCYELVQDLRSQLLEEELRSRDRNEALLALDQELQRFRPYLESSPEATIARLRTAPPELERLLKILSEDPEPWGALQIYFRLSPQEHAALRAGETLIFSAAPLSPEEHVSRRPDLRHHPLPPDLVRGVLESCHRRRIRRRDGQLVFCAEDEDGLPPAAVPEATAYVELQITQQEPGRFTFNGGAGVAVGTQASACVINQLADGVSPSAQQPRNSVANARLAGQARLRRLVTVAANASSGVDLVTRLAGTRPPRSGEEESELSEAGATTADVLEALHAATGMPIVADYYTRLYDPAVVAVTEAPFFEALNRLGDAMRMRWQLDRETKWLQFRSASYYDDRLKEVPNRLLSRWEAARKQRGSLSLNDLVEIAGLSDAQLDAVDMAEGAKRLFGLVEWAAARNSNLRPHLRFLSYLTPAQRQAAASPEGLRFSRLSLLQQQQFLACPLSRTLDWETFVAALPDVTLRIEYTLPGEFEWYAPEDRIGAGGPPLRAARVRERTREAALQAARHFDPEVADEQIVATRLNINFTYTRPEQDTLLVHWFYWNGHWIERLNRDQHQTAPGSRFLQGELP